MTRPSQKPPYWEHLADERVALKYVDVMDNTAPKAHFFMGGWVFLSLILKLL